MAFQKGRSVFQQNHCVQMNLRQSGELFICQQRGILTLLGGPILLEVIDDFDQIPIIL
jgi:hypothetical protein